MGEYVDVDFSFKITRDMAMACVLVLLDLREGLAPGMCLNADFGNVTQILDYEGVPFRCHRCQSADHLVEDCECPFRGMWRKDGTKEWVRVEDLKFKKSKGPLPRTNHLPPSSSPLEEATIHKTSQSSGVLVNIVMGEGAEAEKPIMEVLDLTSPSSGMSLSPLIPFSTISLVGSVISLHDINLLSRSPSLLIRSISS